MDVNELAMVLALWISNLTGYEYISPPPIIVVDAQALKRNCGSRAIFRFDDILIGLNGKWDHDESSYLVHELVHFYQEQQGRRQLHGMTTHGMKAVLRSAEIEANIIQNAYRRDHDLTVRDSINLANRSLKLMQVRKCRFI